MPVITPCRQVDRCACIQYQGVGAGTAGNRVRAVEVDVQEDTVVAVAAVDPVGAVEADDVVVAGAAVDRVVAVAAVEPIGVGIARQADGASTQTHTHSRSR